MSLRGSETTEAISTWRLPRSARAPQDDYVILRKCPWGVMTEEDYNTVSEGIKGRGIVFDLKK
jgi:hypothetical protein